jgi:hypothetical protein
MQEQDRFALAVLLYVQGNAIRLDDPAIVWARHEPIMARLGLAVLAPPQQGKYYHDEDEDHGRANVVHHAVSTSIPAA